MQSIIATGRKDADFDLFCRRTQMAETFANLPPEAMRTLFLTDFYPEFWKLAGVAQRKTKFAEDEKNTSRQILERARQEQNPVRQQYFALSLLIFGELREAQSLINQNLWSYQIRQDFEAFVNWRKVTDEFPPPQRRALIARNMQIAAFLQEKYSELIKKYSQAVINEETCPRVEDYKIWFCWLQGEETMPLSIRCSYNSRKQNAGHYKIVFIDEKNFSNYVDIAPHILDKFKAGKISRTHFSDILRVNLLERHGGLWLDGTIFVTEPLENHKDLLERVFFTTKGVRDKDIKDRWSSSPTFSRWSPATLGTTVHHNPLFAFTKEFFEEYLRDFDKFIDYILLDFMVDLAYENIPVVKKFIDDVPFNNSGFCFTWDYRNSPYVTHPFDKIFNDTFLYYLSWKDPIDMKTPGTVFRELQRRYAPETII